jgi:multimeric flavodoxin WrbA
MPMTILILDGHPMETDEDFNRYLDEITEHLTAKGHAVKRMTLRNLSIRFCTGCWSCWWATPGECVFKDESHSVCREYINSDFVLFASPMIMGFASALTKKTQDKLIPLIHPYFEFVQGEYHHLKRYDVYPKIGLLLEKTPGNDKEDIEITVDLYKRFALNLKSELALAAQMTQSAQEVSDAIDRI